MRTKSLNNAKSEKLSLDKKILTLAILFFVISLGTKLVYSGKAVYKSNQLNELMDKKISLEKEITLLSYDDSKLSSMQYIEKRAFELGFVPMGSGLVALDLDAGTPVAVLSSR